MTAESDIARTRTADRRDLGPIFRARLQELVLRSRLSKAGFAARVGIDRTALSQLLSGKDARLPRAETLAAIARAEEVSLDWLLGLSLDDTMATEVAGDVEIEAGGRGVDEPRLLEWRREAQGAKIRYVPALLPDLMRLPDVTAHEHGGEATDRLETRLATDQKTLALSRATEADMEVCAPAQRFASLARGEGVYAGLPPEIRRAQLSYTAALLDELYPSFRLFLFDETKRYAGPFTVFGARRAAIYLGEMYLVLNARAHIQALTRRFDDLVRDAEISDRDAAGFVRGLLE